MCYTHVFSRTSSHSVEDRLRCHALAVSAGQVRLMTCDHLPENYSETVDVATWSVVCACGEGGKVRWEGGTV